MRFLNHLKRKNRAKLFLILLNYVQAVYDLFWQMMKPLPMATFNKPSTKLWKDYPHFYNKKIFFSWFTGY